MYKIMKEPYTAMHSWYFLVKEYHSATGHFYKTDPWLQRAKINHNTTNNKVCGQTTISHSMTQKKKKKKKEKKKPK